MNSLFDPTLQFQITCHSPDEFQEKVIGWDIAHLQLTQGAYQSSVDIVHTANIQLTKAKHNVGICERGGTIPGVVIIALPLLAVGTERPYYCGSQLSGQECPVLLSAGEYEILSSGAEIDFAIAIDAGILDTEAILLTGYPFASLVRSQRVSIQKQDQLWLMQSIATLMQALKNQSPTLPIRQQERLEKQLIKQLLMSIIPLPEKKKTPPNRRLVARKAEQLLRQYPQQNLTIEQICRHIGCSARNLHLGFKECYATTPRQYAHIVALNSARSQLLHHSVKKNISNIASGLGFVHLGRFSQQYKQLFDELPRDTVERSRKQGA